MPSPAIRRLRLRPAGFEGLARAIVNQQLSVASAGAIWDRLRRRSDLAEPTSLLALTDEDMRAVGLSRGKQATLRGVAAAIESGALDLDALDGRPG